jgi:hypothetical protein
METLTIIFAMAALFLWVRSEANADRRCLSEAQQRHADKVEKLIEAIKEEMHDFHNRLCAIEERRGK